MKGGLEGGGVGVVDGGLMAGEGAAEVGPEQGGVGGDGVGQWVGERGGGVGGVGGRGGGVGDGGEGVLEERVVVDEGVGEGVGDERDEVGHDETTEAVAEGVARAGLALLEGVGLLVAAEGVWPDWMKVGEAME